MSHECGVKGGSQEAVVSGAGFQQIQYLLPSANPHPGKPTCSHLNLTSTNHCSTTWLQSQGICDRRSGSGGGGGGGGCTSAACVFEMQLLHMLHSTATPPCP